MSCENGIPPPNGRWVLKEALEKNENVRPSAVHVPFDVHNSPHSSSV